MVTVGARTEPLQHTLRTKSSDDDALAVTIKRALLTKDASRLRPVVVRVENGKVRLCGRVQTYYAKQLAIHAAISVDGAERIIDEMEVE